MATYKIIPTPIESQGHLFVGRFTVPVDGLWHQVDLSGEVLHVASRNADEVEIWATTHSEESRRVPRFFRVFGTGQPLPPNSRLSYIGTSLTVPNGALVWHLFELHHGAPTTS